jgi:hypothetical protein
MAGRPARCAAQRREKRAPILPRFACGENSSTADGPGGLVLEYQPSRNLSEGDFEGAELTAGPMVRIASTA